MRKSEEEKTKKQRERREKQPGREKRGKKSFLPRGEKMHFDKQIQIPTQHVKGEQS